MSEDEEYWYFERRYLGRAGWFVMSAFAVVGVVFTWQDMQGGYPDGTGAGYWALAGLVAFALLFHASPVGTGFKHVRVGPWGLQVGRWRVPAGSVRTFRVLEEPYALGVWRSHRFLGRKVRNTNYALASKGPAILVEWAGGPRPVLMFTCREIDRVLDLLDRYPDSVLVEFDEPLAASSVHG